MLNERRRRRTRASATPFPARRAARSCCRAGCFASLLEQREIIEHPKRSGRASRSTTSPCRVSIAMSRTCNARQIQRERLPARAAVEARRTRVLFVPAKSTRGLARILPHGKDVLIVRQSGRHRRPVRAVVRRLEHVGMEVVPHVARRRQIGRTFGGVRRFDRRDLRPLRQARRRDRLPVRAAVARDVHETVGRSGPHDVRRRAARPPATKCRDRLPRWFGRDRPGRRSALPCSDRCA